jgi:SAM-dependent methyltransferase
VVWPLAFVYDPLMRGLERRWGSSWRGELLGPLGGHVLEIGAGTGANLPFYPDAVERLVLSEPDWGMRRQLQKKLAELPLATRASVDPSPLDAVTGGPFDAVVSTLVLCTVPDLERAVGRLYELVRPGGTLVLLEHVAADEDPNALAWQRRIDPVWKLAAGGCRLHRRPHEALASVGFRLDTVRFVIPKAPRIVRTIVRGSATR